jgi:PAS domain S-box-containing protein
VNAAFEALFGYAAAELVGDTPRLLQGAETNRAVFGDLKPTLRAGRTWRGRTVNYRKDGTPVRVSWSISPIFDARGAIDGFISVQDDVQRGVERADRRDENTALFENAPFGIYNTTVDGRFTRVNPAMARIYGCDGPADFLTTFSNTDAAFREPGHPYIPAYMDKASREAFEREMAEHGRVTGLECLARRKDHTPFWSQEDARPLRDGDGTLLGYEGFIQDISVRKQGEARLADANRRLRQVAQIAGIGGWELDLRTNELWWDDEVRRIFEVSDDFVPTYARALDFYAPEAQPRIREAVEAAATRGEPFDLELPVVTASGRRLWSRSMGQADVDAAGDVVRLTGVFQDVTARKEAERKLRENAQLLEMAGRLARFGGWAVDLDEGAVRWSDVVADIHEMPREAKPPVDITMAFVADGDRDRLQRAFDACVARGTPYDEEVQLVTATGGLVWVRAAGEAVRDDRGRVVRVQGALQDITERKRVESELRLARDQARAADASKTQFLANISHELRTPLNAILGFADLIRKSPGNADARTQAQYAEYIADSGGHLLELVNDLLDMARIDQGAYHLNDETVDPREVVEATLKLVRDMASKKSITLTTDISREIRAIHADMRAMRQILLNLVTNAIKFTPAGGQVAIRARIADGQFRLEVADTGVGIPADALERVLKPFERVERHLSHDRQGGTGLGLGITRSLVEMHGGHLTLDSEPDVGTTVEVHLPAERLLPG